MRVGVARAIVEARWGPPSSYLSVKASARRDEKESKPVVSRVEGAACDGEARSDAPRVPSEAEARLPLGLLEGVGVEGEGAAPSAASGLGSSRGRVLVDDERLGVDDRVGRDHKGRAGARDEEVAHGGVGLEDDDVADWRRR